MTRTLTRSAMATLIAATFPFAASAQHIANASLYERNVTQQQRIEQGLRDGSLTVQEAAHLERGQAHVSQMEARALADGRLSDAERARISAAQNRQSAAIDRERHDSQRGDPNARSAQRMAADVQRNVNEQQRIAQGVQSGQITHREAARLAQGQARVFGEEARAGADGRIDRNEQRHIQGTQHHQSQAIHQERHDGQHREPSRGHSHRPGQGHWQHGQSHGQTHGWQHSGAAPGYGGNHPGRSAQAATAAAESAAAAAAPRPHSNNGNHYGQFKHAPGAASGAVASAAAPGASASTPAASTASTARTHTNNGHHDGQINRASTVAQHSNGRGNRR